MNNLTYAQNVLAKEEQNPFKLDKTIKTLKILLQFEEEKEDERIMNQVISSHGIDGLKTLVKDLATIIILNGKDDPDFRKNIKFRGKMKRKVKSILNSKK